MLVSRLSWMLCAMPLLLCLITWTAGCNDDSGEAEEAVQGAANDAADNVEGAARGTQGAIEDTAQAATGAMHDARGAARDTLQEAQGVFEGIIGDVQGAVEGQGGAAGEPVADSDQRPQQPGPERSAPGAEGTQDNTPPGPIPADEPADTDQPAATEQPPGDDAT